MCILNKYNLTVNSICISSKASFSSIPTERIVPKIYQLLFFVSKSNKHCSQVGLTLLTKVALSFS